MVIKQLSIQDLRIIKSASINPGNSINIIAGDNGEGKTSILESIYLLGRGKSFRHRETGPFIRTGSDCALVVAKLEDDETVEHRLGVERARTSTRVKYDGIEVLRRSELLRILPLQIITPSSHELIERGPELRRSYLDYGMFHVEHGYLEQLSAYLRGLKQRNSALRQANLDVARSYNRTLSQLGGNIHLHRLSYIQRLNEEVQRLLELLGANFPIHLSLSGGWDSSGTLEEEFLQKEANDLKRGYTGVGVHRADLVIRSHNRPASQRLSRGQQKILVYALKIAQSKIFYEVAANRPILLVDDLGAELDAQYLNKVLCLFAELEQQIFVAMVSTNHLTENYEARMFHVEHGVLSE